jgi:hypothetical protein
VLERLSDLAVAYDVILNFELSTTFVQAVDRWGSMFIEEMTAIGHNISQHSGDQSTEGLTGEARVRELVRQRAAIEAHGAAELPLRRVLRRRRLGGVGGGGRVLGGDRQRRVLPAVAR